MAAPFNVLHIERLHLHVNVLLSLYKGLPVILEHLLKVAEPLVCVEDIAMVQNQ